MRRITLWTSILTLTLASALQAAPLTLEQAVKTAWKKNPDLAMVKEATNQAEAYAQKAKAAFYPRLGLYTEAVRADAPSAFLFKTIDQRQFKNGTDFNEPGMVENIEGGLEVRLSLYNGGRDTLTLGSARAGVAASRASQEVLKHTITQQMVNAWYDTLSSRKFMEIARESVKTVTSQLDAMTIRFKGGSVLKSDLLSLKVRLAEAEERLLASENRLKLSRAALFVLMGMEPDSDAQLSHDAPFSPWLPPDYANGIARALASRHEIKGVEARIAQANHAVKKARSGHLPTVNLMAKLYADDDGLSHDANRANWSVGLRMDLPIFEGFSVTANTHRATAAKRELERMHQKTLLQIRLEVKNAYLRYEEAVKRHQVAMKAVSMGEESLALVKNQYQGGSATITRYLEAELARNSAKIRETAAYFDMQKALAAIARATATTGDGPGSLFAATPKGE